MKTLDTLHRWTGGLIGLVLALLGLSGAILVHRDAWIMLPHAEDARVEDFDAVARATARMMASPDARPQSIIYASDSFGLDRLTFAKGAGAYADQAGTIVTRWDSQWARPEIWMFDFHHHLFAGDAGEVVIGIAGICGLFFVVSGTILWWRTRRTFEARLLPRRFSRPAILRHHRDLGIMAAALLLLSLYTGIAFIFRPVTTLVLGPGAPAAIEKANKAPKAPSAKLSPDVDWAAIVRTAHARFPDAELRIVSLPRKDSGLISVRMRQPAEWLPNGRTMLWFAADSGRLVETRDALAQPLQVRGFNLIYPLHAAKVGGLAYRLVMTLSGLALTLLGSLAAWSFWFARPKPKPRKRPAQVAKAA
ncbi:PepSY-associated TM helix domain-containing protein [Sphingomonas crocodyli]|uniref:PepSY domain-containing protein n=1 Tax=Sphingomonas crocodyli TaxID=1979270 RepID=A0A437MBU4_9SPHN|nr:PepSY-associated TM helix domain-containing protein [Sphingomonas crocodyli]RVT95109.1 PepSY domain-containing protein [Sphingomonas crocodyli]